MMIKRDGLPGQLAEETFAAVKPIFDRYSSMKNPDLPIDRIIGIMDDAFREAWQPKSESK